MSTPDKWAFLDITGNKAPHAGATTCRNYPIPEDILKQIRTTVDSKSKPKTTSNSDFEAELQHIWNGWFASRLIDNECSKSSVHNRLTKVRDRTKELLDAINDLHQTGEAQIETDGYSLPVKALCDLYKQAQSGISRVNNYDDRREDSTTPFVMESIAKAISDHLKIQPTSTKDGLFHVLTMIILNSLERNDQKRTQAMRKAIRNWKLSHNLSVKWNIKR